MAIKYDGFGVRVEGRHFGGAKIPNPPPPTPPPTGDDPQVQEAAAKAAQAARKRRGRQSTILAGESAPLASSDTGGRERLGD